MSDFQVELTIKEAYEDDYGRGIARIGPDALLDIKASPGDVCVVHGDWTAPVKVWRAEREDWDNENVFLDEFTRVSIQTEVDEKTTLEIAQPATAQQIVLNLYRGDQFEFGSDAGKLIKKQWLKRPVSIGDVVPLATNTDIEFIPLVVGDIEPDGISVIREETNIKINGQ